MPAHALVASSRRAGTGVQGSYHQIVPQAQHKDEGQSEGDEHRRHHVEEEHGTCPSPHDELFENDEATSSPPSPSGRRRSRESILGGAMHLSFDEDDHDETLVVQTRTPCAPCAIRLRHELTNPLFDVSEPGGMQIDVSQTFAPRPYWRSWLIRLSFLAVSVESLSATIAHTTHWNRWFYMAYLTHWGLVTSIAYQVCAVVCLVPVVRRRALYQPLGSGKQCSRFVRTTWALFSLAAPVELIICILYWGLEYTPGHSVHYYLVVNHGGIALLLMVDGFLLSSFPLQLKQLVFTVIFCIAYLSWTVIFAESNIPNPNVGESDDYIYSVLEWNSDVKVAEVVSSLCAFVLPPIVFVVFWIMSLSRRHLYDATGYEHEQQIELVGVNGNGNGDMNGDRDVPTASGANGAVDDLEFTIDEDSEFI